MTATGLRQEVRKVKAARHFSRRLVGVCCSAAWMLLQAGCGGGGTPPQREVVVYTSLDQELSEPLLRAYETKTGVKVRAVYDTEATKTAGLVNRLIAEKSSPQADVFWNSEIVRTLVLKREGVLAAYRSPSAEKIPARFRDPDGFWTGFAARARVVGVNPNVLPEAEWPKTFEELAEPEWKDRVAMAHPLFGTTSFHVAALFSQWGPERARAWLTKLRDNGVRIVDGNSTARDLMVAGTVPVCFTDSDDVAAALAQGRTAAMVVPRLDGEQVLLIPNTAALIAGAPHAEEARAFLDYLLSEEAEARLAAGPGAQIPLRPGLSWPAAVPRFEIRPDSGLDYGRIADQLDASVEFCRQIFVR